MKKEKCTVNLGFNICLLNYLRLETNLNSVTGLSSFFVSNFVKSAWSVVSIVFDMGFITVGYTSSSVLELGIVLLHKFIIISSQRRWET